MIDALELDGRSLSLDDVVAVARGRRPVALSAEARAQMEASAAGVAEILDAGHPVYGINTGFGIFANRAISREDATRLTYNLILSHAVGTGEPFAEEVVRAAMLVRANTLAIGHSGARPLVADTLLEMLNAGVTPAVPSQGSLGSSGDLAPLSHLALVFCKDEADRDDQSGYAWFRGERMTGKAALTAAGIPRIVLGPKEGLALNNGATFCAALGALVCHAAARAIATSEVALAMTLEALLGVSTAFDERLHEARGHLGQQEVARRIRELTAGSTLLDRTDKVQDAYSLRCAPQVIGPARETLEFVTHWVEREINASTDNPLLFRSLESSPRWQALSGGNFHGEIIGMGMDFLGIALAEVAAIAERRLFRLMDEKLNEGLPAMLVGHPESAGLNSGLMLLQYTAASLALENQTLAHPDSVHSLPTSAGQEDHNANAATAARHAAQILRNLEHIAALELAAAAQALDLRMRQFPETRLGAGTQPALERVRAVTSFVETDRWLAPDIEAVAGLVRNGDFS